MPALFNKMPLLTPAQEALSKFGVIPERETSYAGCDLKAVMYLPLMTTNSAEGRNTPKIKLFGNLQTLSISSTRSISPVRVLGSSRPIAYTKGAITYAGTMVFATIEKDAFSEIYDTDLAESYLNAASSVIAHQLPPFSIVVTLANEQGASSIQVIHGITIVNYGTTYSINDIYTESVYSYIATDVTPLVQSHEQGRAFSTTAPGINRNGKTITTLLEEAMGQRYSMSSKYYYDTVVKKREDRDNISRSI